MLSSRLPPFGLMGMRARLFQLTGSRSRLRSFCLNSLEHAYLRRLPGRNYGWKWYIDKSDVRRLLDTEGSFELVPVPFQRVNDRFTNFAIFVCICAAYWIPMVLGAACSSHIHRFLVHVLVPFHDDVSRVFEVFGIGRLPVIGNAENYEHVTRLLFAIIALVILSLFEILLKDAHAFGISQRPHFYIAEKHIGKGCVIFPYGWMLSYATFCLQIYSIRLLFGGYYTVSSILFSISCILMCAGIATNIVMCFLIHNNIPPSGDGSDQAEEKTCRICFAPDSSENPLVNVCRCNGSLKWIHSSCVALCGKHKKDGICSVCRSPFRSPRDWLFP